MVSAALISFRKRSMPFLTVDAIIGDQEGLNGVNRQPPNGQKINRRPSKTEYFYRQPSNERAKISRQISFLIFLKFFLNNFFSKMSKIISFY